jgi:hypothetical protein
VADEDAVIIEARRIAGAAAIDHIMSFIHTPSVLTEAEAEQYLNEADEFTETVHDFRKGEAAPHPYQSATEADPDENVQKAIDLRTKIVTPTSSIMTLAYYLKAFSATHGELIGGAPARAPTWSFESYDADEAGRALFAIGPWARHKESKITNSVQFDEGEKGKYTLEQPNNERTAESAVWIPNINRNISIPKSASSDKKLAERLSKMRPVMPLGDVDANKRDHPNKMTPITAYYIMRYMAPWLIRQGWAEQAMPTIAEGEKPVLGRIDVERRTSSKELDDSIADMLSQLSFEESTPIDEMFAFDRIRTTYEYPRNYPHGHETSGAILQPDPKNTDIAIKFGLLQKMYAMLSPSARKSFIKQTKQYVLDSEFKTEIRITVSGAEWTPTLGRGTKEVWFPTGRQNNLAIAESTLVWLEEEPRQFQDEHKIKLPTNVEDPSEMEIISEGAGIVAPGLILLLSERENSHALYDSFSNATTLYARAGRGMLDHRTEFNYVANLAEVAQQPGMIPQLDEEEAVQAQTEAFKSIIANEYEGIYLPISEDEAALIMTDEEGISTTLSIDPTLLNKQWKSSELRQIFGKIIYDREGEIRPGGAPLHELIGGGELTGVGWNCTIKRERADGGGEEPGLTAYALDVGATMRKASRYGAKGFNALGHLVEEQITRSAQQAVRTIRGMPTSSEFDKIVAALLGTANHPGIATSHAAIHYQYLWQQMQSPVKNWDVVTKESFEQGAMLAIESFLDDPALKAIYWMLNERGYINIGNFKDGRPQFFRVPRSKATSEAEFTGLQNAFTTIVIGYYRLMFSQIRQRLVFHRKTTEGRKSGSQTIDISRYWKEMIFDATRNPPDAAMFGMILRFFSQSPKGESPIIAIPTWMPILPESMRDTEAKPDAQMPVNYLKWAYGTDPLDLEAFAEVAAAYHTAKAISYAKDYPHMVERFVNAVNQDNGHAFLFAILQSDESPDLSPESGYAVEKERTIINMGGTGHHLRPPGAPPRPPGAPPPPGGNLPLESKAELEARINVIAEVRAEAMLGGWRGTDKQRVDEARLQATIIFIAEELETFANALGSASDEASVDAAFDWVEGRVVRAPSIQDEAMQSLDELRGRIQAETTSLEDAQKIILEQFIPQLREHANRPLEGDEEE